MQICDSLSTNEDYKIINKAKELLFGIYIMKRGDLLNTNVYKIGKTERSLNTRHNEYSVPNTIVLYYIPVNKVDAIEQLIIFKLKNTKFIKFRVDLGNEYFEGDYEIIKNIIYNLCDAFKIEHNYNINKLIEYTNNNHRPTIKFLNNNNEFDNYNMLNAFISNNNLGTLFKPFYSYTIGHIFKNFFEKLNEIIQKCKKEDYSNREIQDSQYNFVLEIFKEIINVDDIQAKNIYINNIDDKKIFILIEGQFYELNIKHFFYIIYDIIIEIINFIIKSIKKYIFFNKNENENLNLYFEFIKYIKLENYKFKEFINNSKTDKTHLNKEIIKCIYNNKFALEKLINSSNPISEFDKNSYKIVSIITPDINKLRKKYRFKPINAENIITIYVNNTDIIGLYNTSIKLSIENEELDDEPIEIDYEKTTKKYLPDSGICYKTTYKGVEIWYNEKSEIGCLYVDKRFNLISIDELKKIINNMINGTLRINNGTQVNTDAPINNDVIDNGFDSDNNY